MSNIPPTFNPNALHPFTAGAAISHQGQTNTTYIPTSPSPTSSQASSIASSSPQASMPIHSPQPRSGTKYLAQASEYPIFTPFKLERSSPDLSDILSKKGPSVWLVHPSYVTQASAAGNSGGRKP